MPSSLGTMATRPFAFGERPAGYKVPSLPALSGEQAWESVSGRDRSGDKFKQQAKQAALRRFRSRYPLFAGFLQACGETGCSEQEIGCGLQKAAAAMPDFRAELVKCSLDDVDPSWGYYLNKWYNPWRSPNPNIPDVDSRGEAALRTAGRVSGATGLLAGAAAAVPAAVPAALAAAPAFTRALPGHLMSGAAMTAGGLGAASLMGGDNPPAAAPQTSAADSQRAGEVSAPAPAGGVTEHLSKYWPAYAGAGLGAAGLYGLYNQMKSRRRRTEKTAAGFLQPDPAAATGAALPDLPNMVHPPVSPAVGATTPAVKPPSATPPVPAPAPAPVPTPAPAPAPKPPANITVPVAPDAQQRIAERNKEILDLRRENAKNTLWREDDEDSLQQAMNFSKQKQQPSPAPQSVSMTPEEHTNYQRIRGEETAEQTADAQIAPDQQALLRQAHDALSKGDSATAMELAKNIQIPQDQRAIIAKRYGIDRAMLEQGKLPGDLVQPSQENLAKANPDMAKQDPQGFMEMWGQLPTESKWMLGIGLPLGLVGLISLLGGEGGIGSVLMTLLGLGVAGAGGALGGVFGQGAQQGAQGLYAQARQLFGGQAAPKAPTAQAGTSTSPAAAPGQAFDVTQLIGPDGRVDADKMDQVLNNPQARAQLLQLPDAQLMPLVRGLPPDNLALLQSSAATPERIASNGGMSLEEATRLKDLAMHVSG